MTNSIKTIFGNNVARYRQACNLTQEQLAEACDVSTETISHIERGIYGARFGLIQRFTEVLGVEAWRLFFPDEK